ncbi:MAG: LarC family nickel insertion protein [Clostridiales Family XIII bacterium]|jgi:uncharacterized protein (DUF111 family)|nr:LarC family nickel insertion protein [Clostridiales Family XIII bacterium]
MANHKILYFEAPDGISGDMVLGALIDLGADITAIRKELDKFVPGEYGLVPRPFERNGIHGVNLDVLVSEAASGTSGAESGLGDLVHEFEFAEEDRNAPGLDDHVHEYQFLGSPAHTHEHTHRRHRDIKRMISESGIAGRAKAYALAIFETIADAEAAVHKTDKELVAFHEVGAMDSIIDIVGTAIAIDLLGVSEFCCSAPHDGSGSIVCRHGIIPVPVPAVVEMAKGAGIPIIIESDVKTEMITPTGFGIIKGLGAKFEPRLGILPEKAGYGFGKRDTGRLGAVRVTLGEKYVEVEKEE